MTDNIELRASASVWKQGVEFGLWKYEGKQSYYGKIEWEEYSGRMQVEPLIVTSMQVAQTLMDDLWQSGLRPTEGTGSAGSLKATENHLKDMRKIVSKKLGVDL